MKRHRGDSPKTINTMEKIKIYFDGSCQPINPGGGMGVGVKIVTFKDAGVETTKFISELFPPHPNNTNNVAEYLSLKKALEHIIDSGFEQIPVEVFGDSALVINQMKGDWRIVSGNYSHIANHCVALKEKIKSICFQWIPRNENLDADSLSRGIIPGDDDLRITPGFKK